MNNSFKNLLRLYVIIQVSVLIVSFNLITAQSAQENKTTSKIINPVSIIEEQNELTQTKSLSIEEKINKLKEILKQHPHSLLQNSYKYNLSQAYAQKGEQAIRLGKVEEAQELFNLASEVLPTPITPKIFRYYLLPLPVVIGTSGFRTEAVLLMNKFQNHIWNNPESLEQVGLFYISLENPIEAKKCFERAIELEPDNATLYYDDGIALQMGLRLDDAANAFKRSNELDSKKKIGSAALADLYLANGLNQEAEKLYRQQLELDPEHMTAWGGLTLALLEQGQDKGAAESLAKMLTFNSTDVRFLTQMSYLYAVRGDYKSSLKFLSKVNEIQPRYAWAKIIEAHVKRIQNEFSDAENILGEALETAKFSTLYFELGKTLVLANDFDRAVESFENFLKITPENEFKATLGGVIEAQSTQLSKLLDVERRAAILMNNSLTSDSEFQQIEHFVKFSYLVKQLKSEKNSDTGTELAQSLIIPENEFRARPRTAARQSNNQTEYNSWQIPHSKNSKLDLALTEFVSGSDPSKALRLLYAAKQLAEIKTELPQAEALARGAMLFSSEIAKTKVLFPERPTLSEKEKQNYLIAQAQSILGWILFKENKIDEAISELQNSIEKLQFETEKKAIYWKLGTIFESSKKLEEALNSYQSGYDKNSTSAAVQRTVIESVYKKIHGSLDGFQLK